MTCHNFSIFIILCCGVGIVVTVFSLMVNFVSYFEGTIVTILPALALFLLFLILILINFT